MVTQTTEVEPIVNKATDIIATHLEKFKVIKDNILKYNKGAQEAYDQLRNNEECQFNLAGVNRILTAVTKNHKRRINLYLSNHAKMSITDPAITDVVGEYKQWQGNLEKVNELQKEILDAISIEKETIKIFGNVRDILEQQKPKEPEVATEVVQ